MARRGRTTISDVARAAGVSKGAVSMAFNGRPGVAPDTRARILAAAARLDWTPNHRARALSTSRAFAVGLVVARPPELLGGDPFFARFIAGVERVLGDHGRALLLQVVPDLRAEQDSYRRLAADGRVDGFFLLDLRVADPRIGLLRELEMPAVTLGRPDVPSRFPAVLTDEQAGITAAVRHLAELGHTRIAHVAGPANFLHGAGRRGAWERTLASLRLPAAPCVVADFSAAEGATATRHLLDLDDPPTAIVYANDAMAIAGVTAARERGVPVPHGISVTGFDDTELAAHISPALTSVGTDPFGWGRAAAGTLLDAIDGGPAEDAQMPPVRLVVRASTAPPPSRHRA